MPLPLIAAIASPALAILSDDDGEEPSDDLFQRAVMTDEPWLFSVPTARALVTQTKGDERKEIFERLFRAMLHAKTVRERKVLSDTLVRATAMMRDPLVGHKSFKPQIEIPRKVGVSVAATQEGPLFDVDIQLDHLDFMHWFDEKWLDPDTWNQQVLVWEVNDTDISEFMRLYQRFLWIYLYAWMSGAVPVLWINWEHIKTDDEEDDFTHVAGEFTRHQRATASVSGDSAWKIYQKDIDRYFEGVSTYFQRTLSSAEPER